MDLNKLKTFVSVAEAGSVTKAAANLGRTQSAITQQIQNLEESLGFLLFERAKSRVFLSPQGEQLYEMAKSKISELNEQIIQLQNKQIEPEGNIHLGILNDSGTDINIGEKLAEFCKRHQGITFRVSIGDSEFIEQGLIDNRFDFGIKVIFQNPKLLRRQSILTNQHHLYTSKSYLKRVGPIDQYRSLLGLDLLDLSEDFMAIGTFLKKNAKSQLIGLRRRQPQIICPNLMVIKNILMSGYGVAMLPNYLARAGEGKTKLVKLFPKARSLSGGLDIAYRSNRTLRLCERMFLNYMAGTDSIS